MNKIKKECRAIQPLRDIAENNGEFTDCKPSYTFQDVFNLFKIKLFKNGDERRLILQKHCSKNSCVFSEPLIQTGGCFLTVEINKTEFSFIQHCLAAEPSFSKHGSTTANQFAEALYKICVRAINND